MIQDKSFGIILKLKDSSPSRFLVVKQKDHYSFPKGHAEGNESINKTVRRELFEETGISKIKIKKGLFVVEDPYIFEDRGEFYEKTNKYIFGTTKETDIKIREGEIYEASFKTLAEIEEVFRFKEQRSLLLKIKRILNEK